MEENTRPRHLARRRQRPGTQMPEPLEEQGLGRRATRREWFAGAAGAATVLVAQSALRPAAALAAPSGSLLIDATTDQTITGVKTFMKPPVVPDGAFPETAVAGLSARLDAKQALISPGTYIGALGPATKTGPLAITTEAGAATDVPLTLQSHAATVTDHLRIIGPPRSTNPADGDYRVVVDKNMGIQTNAAITVTTGVWQ